MDPSCRLTAAPFHPDPERDGRLAAYCRALGHPHRVHIVRFLVSQQACFAGEIADQLPIAASTVSQHLKHLRDAGLIQGEFDGPRRCYCIVPDAIKDLKQLVASIDG